MGSSQTRQARLGDDSSDDGSERGGEGERGDQDGGQDQDIAAGDDGGDDGAEDGNGEGGGGRGGDGEGGDRDRENVRDVVPKGNFLSLVPMDVQRNPLLMHSPTHVFTQYVKKCHGLDSKIYIPESDWPQLNLSDLPARLYHAFGFEKDEEEVNFTFFRFDNGALVSVPRDSSLATLKQKHLGFRANALLYYKASFEHGPPRVLISIDSKLQGDAHFDKFLAVYHLSSSSYVGLDNGWVPRLTQQQVNAIREEETKLEKELMELKEKYQTLIGNEKTIFKEKVQQHPDSKDHENQERSRLENKLRGLREAKKKESEKIVQMLQRFQGLPGSKHHERALQESVQEYEDLRDRLLTRKREEEKRWAQGKSFREQGGQLGENHRKTTESFFTRPQLDKWHKLVRLH